jgi:hypothetical protein
MHSAILAIELPPDTYSTRQGWQNFAAMIAPVEQNPAVKLLAPNVWQVNFQKAPDAFAQLIVACERFGYAYGILQLDAEPQWLRREGAVPMAKTG